VSQVRFLDLEPWQLNEDILVIECETSIGSMDLHNFYYLSDVVFRLADGCFFLVLERVDLDSIPAHYPANVVLGFLGIRELTAEQSADFDTRSAVDFEYVMYYLFKGGPKFTVMAGDSLFFFRAKAVLFRHFGDRWDAIAAIPDLAAVPAE
jgi:hypothetical protein